MKMNMNIRKAFGGLCIPILALGVFFASCTKELSSEVVPGGGGKGGESEVTLKLQVPGTAAGAKTRAVTPKEENEIDDLYVLAFKVDKDDGQETFDYCVAAKKQSTQGSQGDLSTWTASLKVKDYQQTFVMIANAQGTTRKVNEQISALARNSVGQGKMEMLAKLTETLSEDEKTKGFNADAPGNHRPFTMYGQTASTLITENGGHNLTVSMHRIMAQVRITFTGDAADDTKFEAESVLLYNFNDRARVIPDNLGMTGKDYVKTPTIPQGAVLLPAKVDGKESVPTYEVDKVAKTIEHKIYLFETAQPGDGTELEKHTKRPCLIVKGKYGQDGKSCYYRVDLAKTEPAGGMTYMDVMRNHSYNVTINAVTGRGHDTPQEAMQSKPANITATVVEWNENEIGNIDFDRKHVLGIGTMKYQLGKKGGKDLLQQVKASTGLAWTATLYEADEYGQATNNSPTWIKFAGADGAATSTISGMGTNELEDWKFNVERNDQVPERRAVMRFTAGNLKVDALVVQDQSNPVYINVKIDGKVITEEEFEQLGGWCREMTIEYGPENTELTWKYTGRGVELSQTNDGDGNTHDMEGRANSGGSEDATLPWKGEAKELTGVDNVDYATKDGVLTLIAKGLQGMEAKSIRLFQKKYGVSLETAFVPCTGQTRQIRVKGNMPWTAEMNAQHITDAINKGYLKSVGGNWSGNETGEYINLERLSFNTAKQNLKVGNMTATITFKHATNQQIQPTAKQIQLMGCLAVPGSPERIYQVFGPVQRSWNDRRGQYIDDRTMAPVEGSYMISSQDGNNLKSYAGIDDWLLTSDSEINGYIGTYPSGGALNDDSSGLINDNGNKILTLKESNTPLTGWFIATFVKLVNNSKKKLLGSTNQVFFGAPEQHNNSYMPAQTDRIDVYLTGPDVTGLEVYNQYGRKLAAFHNAHNNTWNDPSGAHSLWFPFKWNNEWPTKGLLVTYKDGYRDNSPDYATFRHWVESYGNMPQNPELYKSEKFKTYYLKPIY